MLFPDAQDGEEPCLEAEHPPQSPHPLGARPSSPRTGWGTPGRFPPRCAPFAPLAPHQPRMLLWGPMGDSFTRRLPDLILGHPAHPIVPFGIPQFSPWGGCSGGWLPCRHQRVTLGGAALRSRHLEGREGGMERSFRRGSKKAARSEQERAGARRQQVKPRGEPPPPPGPVRLPPWVGGGP